MSNHFNLLKFYTLTIFALTSLSLRAQMQVAVSFNAPSCKGYTNGDATATPTGGVMPYTYLWSNGQFGQTSYGLGAGSYSVTVNDAAGNSVVKSTTITEPDAVTSTITPQGGVCDNNLTHIATASGGTAPYTFSWRNLLTGQITTGANLVTPAEGSYFLEVIDSKGCGTSRALTVTAPLNVVVRTLDVECAGHCDGSAEARVSGGKQPFTYAWNFQNKTSQSIFPLPGGTYTVTVTDYNGCQKVASGTVNEGEILKTNLVSTGVCTDNASASVNPTGGTAPYTVKWSNGATGNSVTNLTQGIYFVTVTDAKGCKIDGQVNVSKANGISLVFLKTDPTCGIANGKLEGCIPGGGLGPYTFNWSNGASTQTISNVGAGTYKLVVTDGAGCQDSSTITVNNVSTMTLNKGITQSICGSSTGSASIVSVTGGVAPYAYKWSSGQTTASISNVTAGNYSVTVTDATGCAEITSFNITNSNDFVLGINKTDAACNGVSNGSATAQLIGGVSPISYKWSTGATTAAITNLTAGAYTLTVSDAAGCQQISSTTINNGVALNVNTTTTTSLCNASSGSASVNTVTNGTAPYSYKWSSGQTTQTILNVPAGNYTVSVTDAAGCTAIAQVAVINSNGFTLQIAPTNAACNGVTNGSAVAQVFGGAGGFSYKWSTGAITPTIANVGAGSYSLTVTDASGCKDSSTTTIGFAKTLTINATTANSLCNGTTGSATVTTVTNGTAPFNYTWSNGQTTQTATNLATGSYKVTVTDASGCIADGQVNVQTNPISVSFTATDATCSGIKNGAVTAQVVGGAPGTYTYAWSNGATAATINNLEAGSYQVTVSGAGCTETGTVTVKNTTTLNLTTTTANTLCNGTTGSTTASVTGGTAPLSYTWGNGQTTQTATNLAVGNYNITVTDASGCSVSGQAAVQANPISVVASTTNATCDGVNNGTATALVNDGAIGATYTYLWSNGATTSSLNGLPAGTYKVVASGNGCKDSTTVVINNTVVVSLTTTTSNATCTGSDGAATVTNVTGGVGPFMFKWSNDATTQTALNLPAGNYSVTVTDANGCKASANPVTVNTTNLVIAATPTVTNASCGQNNGKVVFAYAGGTAPYTVKWSGGNNSENLAGGTYNFTITDANGCQTTQSAMVEDKGGVKSSFTASPIANNSSCDSISYNFANTSTGSIVGATYKWLFSGNRASTDQNPTSIFGGTSGEARLITTSTEGCSDTSRQVFNLNTLKVDVQDTALTCQNSGISVLAKNNNPNFPVNYSWTPSSIVTSGATTANPTVTPTALGKNVVYVDITNGLGCTLKDSVIVNSIDKSALKSTDISFEQDCDTRKISFTNASSIADQYSWVFGDSTNPTAGSNQTNPSYTYGQGGEVTVTLIPKLACLDTVRLKVPVRNGSAVSLTTSNDSTVCNANALNLTATSNASKIEWSANRNFIPLSTGATYSATPMARSNYYYVRATDAKGCVALDSVLVNNYAINITYAKTFDVCKGVGKPFSIVNQTPDVLTATWTPASLIEGSNTVLNPTIKATADGTLAVEIKNQYGCTLSDNISVKSREVVAIAKTSANFIYVDDQITLTAEPTGTGYTYKWTPTTDISNTTNAITTATPKQTITYIVEVKDSFGCSDTASVLINVDIPLCQEPYIFIPRAFSPNSDGLNDKMFVRGEYLKELEFAIYNRWGERVFYSTSLESGWDGTFNGKAVAPDVYGYYVKGTCKKGEAFFSKGNITVLK